MNIQKLRQKYPYIYHAILHKDMDGKLGKEINELIQEIKQLKQALKIKDEENANANTN